MPWFENLSRYGRRYVEHGRRLDAAGDTDRACAAWAFASAFQLSGKWRKPNVPRGEFFGPIATFTDGSTVPDMAFLRETSTLAVLRERLPRIRNVLRRARAADVLWEFSGDAAAARVAADAYLEIGSTAMRSGEEHEPFHAAGSLFRAHALATMLNDGDRRAHTRAVIADEVIPLLQCRTGFRSTYRPGETLRGRLGIES